jgi:hypothetical protein
MNLRKEAEEYAKCKLGLDADHDALIENFDWLQVMQDFAHDQIAKAFKLVQDRRSDDRYGDAWWIETMNEALKEIQ